MSEQIAPRRAAVFIAVLVGAGVAVALGVYGRVHTPDFDALPTPLGFTSAGSFKAYATTLVLLLAVGQLIGALWLYGRLPGVGPAPPWLGRAHRAGGTVAFLLSLPVAAFCLYGFGFGTWTTRTTLHSLAGCAFYGAFAAKVILVRSRGVPGWALPIAGGSVLTLVVVLWFTGAWWFFGVAGFGL